MDLYTVEVPKTKVHKLGHFTLHKYPKDKILATLKTHLQDGSVDQANLVAIEIICSGGNLQLWDLIIEFIAENLILILTPKIAAWINEEYKYLNVLKSKLHAQIQNNQEFRNHIAQIITVLCLVPKNCLYMPDKRVEINLDQKSKIVAKEYYIMSSPTGPNEELEYLEEYLNYFIYHMNRNQTKYCLYWIHKLIYLKNIKIKQIASFKAPKSINEHPIWIIWNYIFIRVSVDLNKFLLDIIHLFNIAFARNNYKSATMLLFSGLLLLKYEKQMKWEVKIPIQDSICIRTVGKINYMYRYLRDDNPTLL